MTTPPPEPGYDPNIAATVVKVTDEWIVAVTPMIFNDRITLTSVEEYPYSWTAAWCYYPKGAAAHLAAAAWDPETEREPVGYVKVAGDSR